MLTWLGCRLPRYLVQHYSGCVCEVLLDEINIWISRLRKADYPPQCGWASSHPLKPEESKGEFALCLDVCAGTLVLSCLWTQTGTYTISSSGSQAVGLGLGIVPLRKVFLLPFKISNIDLLVTLIIKMMCAFDKHTCICMVIWMCPLTGLEPPRDKAGPCHCS